MSLSLPLQVLLGVYLGILTGIIPALVAGVLGFVFKYFTGVTVPALGVVVLALAVAGVNGGLLALNDETIRASENSPALVIAIIVVLMLSMYAHAKGDKLGATIPRHVSLRELTERTLSTDVIELVGSRGHVRVTVAGEVDDMEGYPPLPEDLRAELEAGEWTFPADLPLVEIEARFADRLRGDYDLEDVAVRLDERGRATVSAAPPVGGLSRRVPSGKRAVSVDALLPTGVARGDAVRILTPEDTVRGTVVSAMTEKKATGEKRTDGGDGGAEVAVPDGGEKGAGVPEPSPRSPTTEGGEGRITVAVSATDASTLLRTDRGRVIVLSRGVHREYELTTLLRRAGQRFRRATVVEGGSLDGTTIGQANVRDKYGVGILAIRRDRWRIAPAGDTDLQAGDELFVVGTPSALASFAEAAT